MICLDQSNRGPLEKKKKKMWSFADRPSLKGPVRKTPKKELENTQGMSKIHQRNTILTSLHTSIHLITLVRSNYSEFFCLLLSYILVLWDLLLLKIKTNKQCYSGLIRIPYLSYLLNVIAISNRILKDFYQKEYKFFSLSN